MKFAKTLLVRRRAIIAASMSLIIFSSTVSVLMGIGAAPGSVIGNPDAYVITSKSTTSLLNSRLDYDLAEQLLSNDLAVNASPEIFAFAQIHSSAVLIRGVEFGQFIGVEDVRITAGVMPSDPSEAWIGKRLADRLGMGVGHHIPLTGSFGLSVSEVKIVGIIETGSGIDDELIVSLPVVRCLTGISSNEVSIIRVIGDKYQLDKVFGQGTSRFAIYDFSLSNDVVGVDIPTRISLKMKNWGDVNGSARVIITDETANSTILDNDTTLGAGTSVVLAANHTFHSIGNHTIKASLIGPLSQQIYANITVRAPYLTVIAPKQVPQYGNFSITVIDQSLTGVTGATVDVDGTVFITNSTGQCLVNSTLAPGNYTIAASLLGHDPGVSHVTVVNSSSLPQYAVIRIYGLTLSPETVKVGEACTVTILVQNLGNLSGSGTVGTYVDGQQVSAIPITLSPLQTRVIFLNISFSSSGDRTVNSGSQFATVSVEAAYEINPEIVQLILRYGEAGSLNPSNSQLLYHTSKISEANVIVVLVSLAVLSATLVTIGISINFTKEIHDNVKVVGILRALGASSRQLLTIIFKETMLVSLPAAAIGIIGGMILATMVSSTGRLVAFGHLITPVMDPTFLIASVAGSIVICLWSSLMSGIIVTRRHTIKMIRGLKDDASRQMTLSEILGDE